MTRPSIRSLSSVRARVGAAVLALTAAACGGGAKPSGAPSPVEAPHAAAGDTLYLIEHVVRADRREQFQHFLTDSYWPAVVKLAATDSSAARILRTTRVLYPSRANEDGTYSYVFLIDPVARGESYNIRDLLARAYAPQETERRYRELTESWARASFTARPYVQPPYPAGR